MANQDTTTPVPGASPGAPPATKVPQGERPTDQQQKQDGDTTTKPRPDQA